MPELDPQQRLKIFVRTMLLASVSALTFAWPVHAQTAAPSASSGKPANSAAAKTAKSDKKSDTKAAAPSAKKGTKKDAKADGKPKASTKTADKSKPVGKSTIAKKTAAKLTTKPAVPLPLRRPTMVASAGNTIPLTATSSTASAASPVPREIAPAARASPPRAPLVESSGTTSASDVEAVRRAVATLRSGDPAETLRLAAAMPDPLAGKLTEWIVLRSDNNGASFARYNTFIAANPSWPSLGMLRRRAESMIWAEQTDPQTVLAFFASNPPLSGKGRLSRARAYIAQGDRAKAQALVREAWRNDALPSETETQAREEFGPLFQHGDDKARMERRLYANDEDSGLRAAKRLGGVQLAIARLRIAVNDKAGNTKALTDAVPHDARRDIGFLFAQLQLLRRADKITEAGQLMLTVPKDTSHLHDTDQWWIERRLLARKLLDVNEPKLAYQVARDATPPAKEIYKIESQFTAGWIALRFLNDPQTAMAHFVRIPAVTDNPISLSRAGYWMGRTAEAMGRTQEARKYYESAAQWPTAYYGQISRARIGLGEMVIHAPPASAAQRASIERLELVRALEILYALDERAMVVPFLADLGDKLEDAGALAALGEITARNRDARGMMQLGKAALARGYSFGHYAFPTIGIPEYTPVGPPIDPSLVYSIVRTESAFYQGDVSGAQAMGLMQVTPAAGQYVCKRVGCVFDKKKLLRDSVYNVQLGSAELATVLEDYRGSYIMAFAAYNAGRGRVKEWVARYGDPRDPSVDPIDWVERIPFAETRNYVQRVMENLQVYRVRFGGGSRLMIEADLRRGGGAAE
jgi:soluble lytic murein transglycosylase